MGSPPSNPNRFSKTRRPRAGIASRDSSRNLCMGSSSSSSHASSYGVFWNPGSCRRSVRETSDSIKFLVRAFFKCCSGKRRSGVTFKKSAILLMVGFHFPVFGLIAGLFKFMYSPIWVGCIPNALLSWEQLSYPCIRIIFKNGAFLILICKS